VRFDDLVVEHPDFHRENLEFVVGFLTGRTPDNLDMVPVQAVLRVVGELERRGPLHNGVLQPLSTRAAGFRQLVSGLLGSNADETVVSRIEKVATRTGLPAVNVVWAGIMLYPAVPWSQGHVCGRFRQTRLMKFMARGAS